MIDATTSEPTLKTMLFMLPTIPATYAERERLRPIGRNIERTQTMIDQVREIALYADAAGCAGADRASFPFRKTGSVGRSDPLPCRSRGAHYAH